MAEKWSSGNAACTMDDALQGWATMLTIVDPPNTDSPTPTFLPTARRRDLSPSLVSGRRMGIASPWPPSNSDSRRIPRLALPN